MKEPNEVPDIQPCYIVDKASLKKRKGLKIGKFVYYHNAEGRRRCIVISDEINVKGDI